MGSGARHFLLVCILLLGFTVPPAQAAGTVELISPVNGAWTNQSNADLPFFFMFTDDAYASASCTLYVNSLSRGSAQAPNATSAFIYANSNFPEGTSQWSVICQNSSNIYSETRTLYADRSAPSVSLTSPGNGANTGLGSVDFVFRFSDALSQQASCTLFVNGSVMGSNSTTQKNTDTHMAVSLAAGDWKWLVKCTEIAGGTGISAEYTLHMAAPLSVRLVSPGNVTYNSLEDLGLVFMLNGSPSWMGYSLDRAPNVTITGNATFNPGNEGQHLIELYARDQTGAADYEYVYFTVRTPMRMIFTQMENMYDSDYVLANVTADKDAGWCGLSLDGGANMSMVNVSQRSRYYNLTGLGEGYHRIVVWCNESAGFWSAESSANFSVMLTGFIIDVKNPQNRTYWNTTSLEIAAEILRDAKGCAFYLDAQGPVSMLNQTQKYWYYNLASIGDGSHILTVSCNDTVGFSNSTSVRFTARSAGCGDNDSTSCLGHQQCSGSSCVDINCTGCSYAASHTCVDYECCDNEKCTAEKACISNSCVNVECACGVIQDHACVPYDCCSNFDCPSNHQCNLTLHACIKKELIISVPGSVVSGQRFTVSVHDQEGNAMSGATVRIIYPSGASENLTTNSQGLATAFAKESGTVAIIAELVGYEAKATSAEFVPGLDWSVVMVVFVVMILGVGGFFYWRQLPPVSLSKKIAGQNIILRVKNRTSEQFDNVSIMDSLPSGAFMSSSIDPGIETYGKDDHLTWFAALNPGEEIVINYQAVQTSDRFSVKLGEEEYESGHGITGIVQELIGKLLPKKRNTAVYGA